MEFTHEKPIEAVPLRMMFTAAGAELDAYCDGHWIEVLRLDRDGTVAVSEHGQIISGKMAKAGFKVCGSPSIGEKQRVEVRVGSRRLIAAARGALDESEVK